MKHIQILLNNMKTRNIILTMTLVFSTMLVFAKSITHSFKVEGQCGDCKERIEAALDIKGITFAEWNEETKMLTVRFNDKKITEDEIHTLISNLGYATDKLEANKAAEGKLPKCCQPKDNKKSCCASDKCSK